MKGSESLNKPFNGNVSDRLLVKYYKGKVFYYVGSKGGKNGEYKTQMNNWWRCPCCNEVVGQRVIAHKHIHDQRKKKFCEKCGQAILRESDAP